MRRRDFIIGLSLASAGLPAHAQQSAAPARRIAVLALPPLIGRIESGVRGREQTFYDRLRGLDWVEGRNLAIDRYTVEGQGESREAPVRKAVAESPDVIVVLIDAEARLLGGITHTIPIVFAASKSVTYQATPGGVNMTGIAVEDTDAEAWGKRLSLLRQALSAGAGIAYLGPQLLWEAGEGKALQAAAQQLGVTVSPVLFDLGVPPETESAIVAAQRQGAAGLVLSETGTIWINRKMIADSARQHRLATMFPFHEGADLGGLMSYELDGGAVARQLAEIVDRILKGENPSAIPVQAASKYEFVVNKTTAAFLDLTLPPALIAGAERVIE
jgi:putative ABC transport system substrate-binding protein